MKLLSKLAQSLAKIQLTYACALERLGIWLLASWSPTESPKYIDVSRPVIILRNLYYYYLYIEKESETWWCWKGMETGSGVKSFRGGLRVWLSHQRSLLEWAWDFCGHRSARYLISIPITWMTAGVSIFTAVCMSLSADLNEKKRYFVILLLRTTLTCSISTFYRYTI